LSCRFESFYCSPLALLNSLLLSYLHSSARSAGQLCHANPEQAVLPLEWWQNPHEVCTAFAVAEMSEDRLHSAGLGNWRRALQTGSEDDQKKEKRKKKKKKREKYSCELFITVLNSTFSEDSYDVCTRYTFLHLLPNALMHTL